MGDLFFGPLITLVAAGFDRVKCGRAATNGLAFIFEKSFDKT